MNNEIKTISPFKHFCMTIGNLPTAYIESMSYYETLLWLCKYLENTINPAVNNNAEALKELQEYVANYFDNLDVQDEINNKLDEMADNGTLEQIINVEMIGTLENLTTTDKSNLVNAINEVNTNINKLNLTNGVGYDLSTPSADIVISNPNITYSGAISVVSDSTGSVAKIYGYWSYANNTESPQGGTITLKNTGLNPTSQFYISPMGIIYGSDGSVWAEECTIKANGDIEFSESSFAAGTSRGVYLLPCIYFMRDFGD